MNIKKARVSEHIVFSDEEAKQKLYKTTPLNDIGLVLLDIAKSTSRYHSFIDNQTYPRPSHPLPDRRLAPEFTFVAIITSLRCTLESERRVVDEIVKKTNGSVMELGELSEDYLRDTLRPAGLANQKSRWIKEGLSTFLSEQDYSINHLQQLADQELRNKILSLKGMGPKATDCFLLLGLERPVFPVDANIFKLIAKIFPQKITKTSSPDFSNRHHVKNTKDLIESSFVKDVKLYQILHTYLLLTEKHGVRL